MFWDWALGGHVGQKEPRWGEARPRPSPSPWAAPGSSPYCRLRGNAVGCITDHILDAPLIHGEGQGGCDEWWTVRSFVGGEDSDLIVRYYLYNSVIRGKLLSPQIYFLRIVRVRET